MSTTVQEYIDTYRERVNALYANVEQWVAPLSTEIQNIQVLERASGSYPVPCLKMKTSDGSEIARLEPIGTWILGAEGRVDLKGRIDKTAIVYLQQAGSDLAENESVPLFQGVKQDGWYWIEDARRGRAKLITQALFRDLVSEVSDYAFE